MQQRLSVFIGERRDRIGTLAYDPVRPGASQFCYSDSWVSERSAFAISPELTLSLQWFYLNDTDRRSPFPFAFADTEPDSWGRRLIKRSFRKAGLNRELSEVDFLLAVDDFSRVGAIRFALEGHQPDDVEEGKRRTPPVIELGKIVRSSRRFEMDEETDADLDYLEGKGTSLGGARPNALFSTKTDVLPSESLRVSMTKEASSKARFLDSNLRVLQDSMPPPAKL